MDRVISIGNEVHVHMDKETTENLSSYVSEVFKEAHNNHMDQETIRHALDLFPKTVQATTKGPSNNYLSNMNITNDVSSEE